MFRFKTNEINSFNKKKCFSIKIFLMTVLFLKFLAYWEIDSEKDFL